MRPNESLLAPQPASTKTDPPPVISQPEIMPRHVRQTAETPNSVVVQVGTSATDARRMLVLKTWAVANGDLARAASMLGIEEQTLQLELAGYVSNGEAKPTKKRRP